MRLIPKRWAVAVAVSNDETRQYLGGVHVVELADGGVRIETTDGQRMIRVEGKTVPAEEFPTFDGVDPGDAELREGIIPTKAFVDGLKAVPKNAHMPVLGHMAVTINGDTATLASTDLQQKSIAKVDVITGPFPKIDQVIPQGEPTVRVCVNAQLLGETLLALSKMGGTDRYGKAAVTISIFGQPTEEIVGTLKVMLLTTKGEEGEPITALVSPMRVVKTNA